jgi:hypothetical protein
VKAAGQQVITKVSKNSQEYPTIPVTRRNFLATSASSGLRPRIPEGNR